MIKYTYIDNYHITNDIYENKSKKIQYLKHFNLLYYINYNFSRREQCIYAILNSPLPPDIKFIYQFIKKKFSNSRLNFTNDKNFKSNIRYTLTYNKEIFINRKVQYNTIIKSVWSILSLDKVYLKLIKSKKKFN